MIMNPRRRHGRNRKIRKRKNILKHNRCWYDRSIENNPQFRDGYYENNNMINKYTCASIKTKRRKGGYKHKGLYGKAKLYNHHDLVEVRRMDVDEAELNGTNLHKRVK